MPHPKSFSLIALDRHCGANNHLGTCGNHWQADQKSPFRADNFRAYWLTDERLRTRLAARSRSLLLRHERLRMQALNLRIRALLRKQLLVICGLLSSSMLEYRAGRHRC
jgi:hypothetical protein